MKYFKYIFLKQIAAIVFVAFFLSCSTKEKEPVFYEKYNWIDFEFDRATAFWYMPKSNSLNLIVNDDKLNPSIIHTKDIDVSMTSKINLIMSSNGDDNLIINCFSPDFGIVFYQNNTIVAHISISSSCNSVKYFPNSTDYKIEAQKFAPILRAVGMPMSQWQTL